MKIWLWNHYASNMYRDGAGRHFWFAKKLIARGYDVSVFCASTFLNGNDSIELDGKYDVRNKENVPFVIVKTSEYKGNGLSRIKNMSGFFFNLFPVAKKYAKENGRPDVIVASSVHPLTMVAGILISRKFHVPCVCEIRDLWPEAIFAFGKAKENSLLGRILKRGEHWIYRNADALIFTKEGDTDYLKEQHWTTDSGGDIDLKKCNYINNGVDVNRYKKQIADDILSDPDLEDDSKINIIYTGIIRPVNNVGNILDTAKYFLGNESYNNVQFLIYGDGSDLENLKARVNDESIVNVKLKGFVERKYIPYVLSKSYVNLLNYSQSQYNWSRGNSSNKLFEYMASGKPIISTVKMGYSILNKYSCGFELDECTPETLADCIKKVIQMPDSDYQQMCENSLNGVKDFDFEVLTDKLENVVNGVIR